MWENYVPFFKAETQNNVEYIFSWMMIFWFFFKLPHFFKITLFTFIFNRHSSLMSTLFVARLFFSYFPSRYRSFQRIILFGFSCIAILYSKKSHKINTDLYGKMEYWAFTDWLTIFFFVFRVQILTLFNSATSVQKVCIISTMWIVFPKYHRLFSL